MKNLIEAKTQIEELLNKLSELKKPALAKINFAKADCGISESEYAVCKDDICYLHDRIDSLRQFLWNISDALYQHANVGHLPPLQTPEQMQKALDALGLSESYKVEKRTIYASDGAPASWLEIKSK